MFKWSRKRVVSQPICFKECKTSTQVSFELPLLVKYFFPSAFSIIYCTGCYRVHKKQINKQTKNRRPGRSGNVVTSVWTGRRQPWIQSPGLPLSGCVTLAGYLTSTDWMNESCPDLTASF